VYCEGSTSLVFLRYKPALDVRDEDSPSSRVLKKSASGVLASLRGSTYGAEYDSPLRLLRPCWTAILSTLHGQLESSQTSIPVMAAGAKMSFSATC
jgi:hypothetical protein